MRRHAALILLTAVGTIPASTASAQNAVPETPPELRDFRLDQPNPQPESAPPVTQPVIPPPVIRTVTEPAPERTTPSPRQTEPTPRRELTRTSAAEPAADDPETTSLAPVSPEPTKVAPPPASETSTTDGSVPVDSAANKTVADENGWLWPAILGGIFALALLAFLLWRRRRRAYRPATESEAAPALANQAIPARTNPQPPMPVTPPPSPAPRPAIADPVSTDVTVQFMPEKATISFTSLTVKGQLQIANNGKVAADAMQLRAVLLSASNQQQQAINSFFANPAQVEPTALGEAKPGERLGLALELSVPLSEMQSFPLGDQRLLVPILIATLSYTNEKGVAHEARLACMIGREAQPPQAKMGPLRLDKGPRSFAPLGQRPVFT